MAVLPSTRGQQERDLLYDASGVIAVGGTAQLLLPEAKSRSYLLIQNIDPAADIMVEFGGARATATIAAGVVTGFSITNAGAGYTRAPRVELLGGGDGGNSAFIAVGQQGYPAPGDAGYAWPRTTDMSRFKPAKVHATLSGGAVNAIVIEDPGFGYVAAPYVRITNDLLDPSGYAEPNATSGILIPPAGGQILFNGTVCPTDAIGIWSASAARYTCKFLP